MKRRLLTLTTLLLLVQPIGQAVADPFDAGPAAALEIDAVSGPDVALSDTVKPSAEPAAAESKSAALTPTEKAEADPVGLATEVVQDVRAGDWRHAVAGILALLMFGLSRFRGKVGIFKGDRGGAILVGLLGFGGGISTWLASDVPLDWRLFAGSMFVVWTSVGAYTWFKRLIWPSDKK